jgi:hypothetical protein
MTNRAGPIWYLARDGEQYGPLSLAELEDRVRLGLVLPFGYVWTYGWAAWEPAHEALSIFS